MNKWRKDGSLLFTVYLHTSVAEIDEPVKLDPAKKIPILATYVNVVSPAITHRQPEEPRAQVWMRKGESEEVASWVRLATDDEVRHPGHADLRLHFSKTGRPNWVTPQTASRSNFILIPIVAENRRSMRGTRSH